MNILKSLMFSLSLFLMGIAFDNSAITEFNTTSDYSIKIHYGELPKNTYMRGTAFAVTDEGDYITAQHVVSGCSTTYVKYFGNWVKADYIKKHQNSDLALVHISEDTNPVRISLQDGQAQIVKMVGFPGKTGDKFYENVARYVVTTNFIATGLFNVKGAADIWAVEDNEQKKEHITGKYQGMSGGPILDMDDYVAGVIVAESGNDPLIATMMPNDILDLLTNKQLINNQRSEHISTSKKDMLDNSSITEVMCKNE
jgi:S1-C subfamily serine protease